MCVCVCVCGMFVCVCVSKTNIETLSCLLFQLENWSCLHEKGGGLVEGIIDTILKSNKNIYDAIRNEISVSYGYNKLIKHTSKLTKMIHTNLIFKTYRKIKFEIFLCLYQL